MSSETERHPFADDLTDDVTLVSSALSGEAVGRETVLKIVKAGGAQYRNLTRTFLGETGGRRFLEYDFELDGGIKGAGLVSITLDSNGGVTHLQIAFTPIDAALAMGEGIKKAVSGEVDPALFR